MSELCPETCTNRILLGIQERNSDQARVVRDVTGCERAFSLGVPKANPSDPADYIFDAVKVHDYNGQRSLDPTELERVNAEVITRTGEWLDQKDRVDSCRGYVEVVHKGLIANVCEVELRPL
jgi:hypothetical protein